MSEPRKILVSPGYGAGWTTCNEDELRPFMATYQPIIDWLEAGNRFNDDDCHIYAGDEPMHFKDGANPLLVQMVRDAQKQGVLEATKPDGSEPYVCVLGADDLVVEAVVGPYRIEEYDGSERVVTAAEQKWY